MKWNKFLPNAKESAKAVYAIQARINGVWDNPYLLAIGPLSTDTVADIIAILEHYGVA